MLHPRAASAGGARARADPGSSFARASGGRNWARHGRALRCEPPCGRHYPQARRGRFHAAPSLTQNQLRLVVRARGVEREGLHARDPQEPVSEVLRPAGRGPRRAARGGFGRVREGRAAVARDRRAARSDLRTAERPAGAQMTGKNRPCAARLREKQSLEVPRGVIPLSTRRSRAARWRPRTGFAPYSRGAPRSGRPAAV